ncbi:MAG TPA: hypothetical protein VER03_16535 [Bryobacteraceae bacterium]|nr:hypothetical protein [Bryobacteraceae bacterium]
MLRPFLLILAAALAAYGEDLDRDGLDDVLEQQLLEKFVPTFFVHPGDCDSGPAEFASEATDPKIVAKNGSIYGQAFASRDAIEIHYYHLWSRDCGRRMHHDLDAESVSVLLRKDGDVWKAAYWYAAAHENTLCDMSHGVKASTPERGERVWISKDKHASFISRELCAKGCGNDDCSSDTPLKLGKIINLGEAGAPMNGAAWIASAAWPLAAKMQPDFTDALIARMPQGSAAELIPAREPVMGMRSTIKVAGTTYGAIETGRDHTGNAVSTGVGTAVSSTGRALRRAYRWVVR